MTSSRLETTLLIITNVVQGREIYLDHAFPVEPVAGQHVLRIESGAPPQKRFLLIVPCAASRLSLHTAARTDVLPAADDEVFIFLLFLGLTRAQPSSTHA